MLSIIAKRRTACEQIRFEKKYLSQSETDLHTIRRAQEVLQEVAKEVESKVHSHLSTIVTKCLKMVFGDNTYGFEIEFVAKRGKTEAVIQLTRETHKLDPLDSTGGGINDVAAFALRIGVLALRLPRLSFILFLDEPFRNVSEGYRGKVAAMLEMLTEELGFQFILSTHQTELKIGNVIEL